jgi:hypothetical protein
MKHIQTLPTIKMEEQVVRTMYHDGNVPPELMDCIHLCFDGMLGYKEDKEFDWKCRLVAIMGVAQIDAGVALEICSGGTMHSLAQTLIAEGVGDIVFAVQASISVDLTWKSYGQHKVQSLKVLLMRV